MLIGVDVDDVLVDFVTPFVEYMNKTYGTSLTRDHVVAFDVWDILGGSKEEAKKKIHEFYETKSFKELQPMQEALSGVKYLSEKHTLVVITSRSPHLSSLTTEWIKQYFPNTFSNIYFTGHWMNPEIKMKKADVCAQLHVDVMIEDSLEYAQECAEKGTTVLLVDAPWNQAYHLPAQVVRTRGWEEILNYFK
ncbi:MAG: hypothetical protein HY832_02680 [Candidatus Aenigmarchaeota archaeon]|nr:hypothetical protein [Candidatus Aenigmarchaeota archaeon]